MTFSDDYQLGSEKAKGKRAKSRFSLPPLATKRASLALPSAFIGMLERAGFRNVACPAWHRPSPSPQFRISDRGHVMDEVGRLAGNWRAPLIPPETVRSTRGRKREKRGVRVFQGPKTARKNYTRLNSIGTRFN